MQNWHGTRYTLQHFPADGINGFCVLLIVPTDRRRDCIRRAFQKKDAAGFRTDLWRFAAMTDLTAETILRGAASTAAAMDRQSNFSRKSHAVTRLGHRRPPDISGQIDRGNVHEIVIRKPRMCFKLRCRPHWAAAVSGLFPGPVQSLFLSNRSECSDARSSLGKTNAGGHSHDKPGRHQ